MINGKITKLKNKNGEVTFPITSSQAVLMSDGVTSVEDAINNISVSSSGDAQSTSFNNKENGMTATNVQDAIEENKEAIESNKTSILSLEKLVGQANKTLIEECNKLLDI